MSDTSHEAKDKEATTTAKTLSSWLKVNIDSKNADIPILACCLVSGLCDSSVYASWECFVSMQTGNTIFLALGASNQPSDRPYGWLKSLTSIVFFMVGCFLFSQTRRIGPLRRGVLGVSFLVQCLSIFIAAALVQGRVIQSYNNYDDKAPGFPQFRELIPLAFLAFQSGGQMASSRLLGLNEVPTTVLTSVYCDFISDPKLISGLKENPKRNRRFWAIFNLLVGGIAGGWLTRSAAGMVSALWISGFIKLVITVAWFFWKADEEYQV